MSTSFPPSCEQFLKSISPVVNFVESKRFVPRLGAQCRKDGAWNSWEVLGAQELDFKHHRVVFGSLGNAFFLDSESSEKIM